MNKVLIMYNSKYGFTKKYVDWLSPELNADVYPVKKIKPGMLDSYDIIILGSGLFAGNITGKKILISNKEKLKNKKLIIFTCGIADVEDIESMEAINKKILSEMPEELSSQIKIFNLQGGINYSKLSFMHKTLMRITYKALSHKASSDLTRDNIMFLEAYGKDRDYTDKKYITVISDYVRQL